MRKNVPAIAVITGLLLFPIVAYVGSYFALLDAPQFVEPEKGYFLLRRAGFKAGGKWSETAFHPLIELDQRVRPRFWCDYTESGKRFAGEP